MKFLKIKKIQNCESEPIYHLTVKKNQNFFGNTLCLHNCGYRGNIGVILMNLGTVPFEIKKGDRIAQMVFNWVALPELEFADELSSTDRNDGGFGSTGKN